MNGNGTNPAAPPASRASLSPFLWLAVGVLFYVCFFSNLGAIGLTGPDEPRYASIARSMAESGDWVTPRLNGQPWFEKPVLYYWKAGAVFRIFGVNEVTARLPSALAGAFATLVLAWAAKRRFGEPTAFLGLLMTPTAVGIFVFARAATPDMLFCASLTGAMCAASEIIWSTSSRTLNALLLRFAFGVLLGGAALAKGPAALVLAGGSVLLWAVVSKRWRDAFRMFHPAAILSFSVVALPWYVLCARRNPDFLHVFIWQHNFERFLTPEFHHPQPFWFFFAILPIAIIPWTPLLLLCARDARRGWREKSFTGSPSLFFAAWVLFPLLFFSFSKSKLPGYILPAVPALVLLMSRSAALAFEERTRLVRWTLTSTCVVLFLMALGAAAYVSPLLPGRSALRQWPLVDGIALFVMIAAGFTLLRARRDLRPLVLSSALLVAMLIEMAGVFILPWQDSVRSARFAAKVTAQILGPSEPLFVYGLNRDWEYGFNFYLHREIQEWSPDAPRPCWVIVGSPSALSPKFMIHPKDVVPLSEGNRSTPAWLVRLDGRAPAP